MKKLTVFSLLLICSMILYAQNISQYFDARDGKTYKVITLGSQIWMAENLNYETDKGSWCYDNSSYNCIYYGKLYDFETAQQVCMDGWQLPSKEDYDTLFHYFSSKNESSENIFTLISREFNVAYGGWYGEYSGSYQMGNHARFWTSTPKTKLNAWYVGFYKTSGNIVSEYDSKALGLSVRCIKKH